MKSFLKFFRKLSPKDYKILLGFLALVIIIFLIPFSQIKLVCNLKVGDNQICLELQYPLTELSQLKEPENKSSPTSDKIAKSLRTRYDDYSVLLIGYTEQKECLKKELRPPHLLYRFI